MPADVQTNGEGNDRRGEPRWHPAVRRPVATADAASRRFDSTGFDLADALPGPRYSTRRRGNFGHVWPGQAGDHAVHVGRTGASRHLGPETGRTRQVAGRIPADCHANSRDAHLGTLSANRRPIGQAGHHSLGRPGRQQPLHRCPCRPDRSAARSQSREFWSPGHGFPALRFGALEAASRQRGAAVLRGAARRDRHHQRHHHTGPVCRHAGTKIRPVPHHGSSGRSRVFDLHAEVSSGSEQPENAAAAGLIGADRWRSPAG